MPLRNTLKEKRSDIMKEEDLFKKYQDEINELTKINNQIAEDYSKLKLDFERFIEDMAKIEGELPHLNQQEFNHRMLELYGIVKDSYKNLFDLYGITFANIQRINRMDLYVKMLFETLAEYEDFSDLKNKIEKLEKDTELLEDKGIRWVLQELKEKMKELEETDNNGE